MMTTVKSGVWLVLVLNVGISSSGSVAWAQGETQVGKAGLPDRLLSPVRKEREKAFDEIQRQHGELVNGLLKNFETLSQNPDKTYGSALHWTVMLLGRLRVKEAAGPMLGSIDFRLDMLTAPPGGRYGLTSEYPVAAALKEIGGKRVSDSIFQSILQPVSDRVLVLSAWVLADDDVLGREVASMVAQKKLDELKAYKHRNNITDDPVLDSQGRNMERLLQLLNKEETVTLAVYNLKQ